MKRLLALALALLLLTGCRVDPAMPETTEPKETTAPTAPASRVEALQPGVVSYPLPEGDWFGIAALGESILLMGTGENTPLCLLDGETGAPAAETRLDFTLGGPACLQVMDRGVACYQEAGRRLVLLDEGLRQVAEATLPDTMVGMPQIAPDGRTVFFCAPGEIRGMDLGTGISRLIKKQPSQYLELMGVLFDGTVLACRVVEEDGEKYVGFLSAEDGAALGKDPALESIESLGDAYLLRRTDGIVPQLVYGWREGDSGCLSQKGRGGLIPALPMGGGVELSWKDGALALTLYDFASGRCRGETRISGVAAPAAEAPAKIGLWLLTNGGDGEGQLLRWDPEQTPSADKAVYTGPRYTAQHPDTQGLEACRVLAQELGERYGVDIRLGAEVAEAKDYRFEEEYQVDAYLQGLMALEKALGAYPEGFIATACSGSETGVLHIGLVRSISGDLAGLQYWPDGDAHIALALTGSVERMFHHELCHVLDTYIFANSLAYDQWDDLNPGDFSYSYRYEGYHDLGDSPYLQGEDPAFIDAYSMTYPKEDRARILEYAMEPGQEALFAGSALQAKLRQICLAIREAFGWEEDPRTFPWEQYWKKPVA